MSKNKKQKTLQQKLSTHFGVKICENALEIKVDSDERTVKGIANTFFFIDSDFDMLIPGVSTKSIADRGPNSNATAKIKHQTDHILNTKNAIGRFTVLDERKVDGFDVIYFESFIPDTVKGNDHLENYKELIYDNHSIGFRYKNLIFAERDSVNELSRAAWNEFFPKALNPEIAEELGFFWVVKEIELFEISVVSFGANQLTANLGGKSKESNNRLKTEVLERLDNLNAQLKSEVEVKDDKKNIRLEVLQLKQIITDLELIEPSKKGTSGNVKPSNKDTDNEESKSKNYLLNNIAKKL